MAEQAVKTTDFEIEAAFESARVRGPEPLAKTVLYVQEYNLLIVELSNGRRLVMAVEDIQGLGGATHKQIEHYELLGGGTGISFPELDVDLYVPALMEGVYGNRRWMSELGRKGGGATSVAKGLASRANGAKGGRPRKAVA